MNAVNENKGKNGTGVEFDEEGWWERFLWSALPPARVCFSAFFRRTGLPIRALRPV